MGIFQNDRNGERGGRRGGGGGERDFEDRYRERYEQSGDDRDRMGWRDPDDGDRERRFGRFGRWDEDRGRDDDRQRYQGWGGQSGSQAGGMSSDRMGRHAGGGGMSGSMSDNMYREQTGYRERDMYDRERESQQGYRGGQQRGSWGTGGQSQGEDFGGTLGHVDRQYGQQRGSQWGTSGPFSGGHRGKGPSGYTRSDERIREDVCDALSDDDNIDASNIEIQVKNGEVTLSGTVTDRRTKRMAEDCIEHVRGVKDVTNNIRVQEREQQSSQSSGGMGGKSPSHAQSVTSSPDRDTDNGKRPRA